MISYQTRRLLAAQCEEKAREKKKTDATLKFGTRRLQELPGVSY